MRTIDRSTAFRRDFRRLRADPRHRDIERLFLDIVTALVSDLPLPAQQRDHPLSGEWVGYRDCHLRFDLVLIYRKRGAEVLELVRLGSHSELFGK